MTQSAADLFTSIVGRHSGGTDAVADGIAAQEATPAAAPVLVIAPQPFYEDRGTPIAIRHVLEALSQSGCAVDVVTYPVGRELPLPGVRYFRAANPFRIRRVPIGFSLRKVLLDLTLIGTALARLRATRYRCIHAVEEAAFPAVILGRRAGIPVIYDMQSSLPDQMRTHLVFRGAWVQRVLRRFESWLLRRADIVVSSSGLAAQVRAQIPEARVQEWRFPAGVRRCDREAGDRLRRKLDIPPWAPVVLYSGTFEAYQGLMLLLEAAPRVLAGVPSAVFVLVGGSAAEAEALRVRADALRLNGAVRLIGQQLRSDMGTFYAMADVLVSPRLYGGNLPLKIFDYLASGRPIVATDIPAHRSVLDDTRAALAKPSPAGLAAAITDLLRDPDRAASLGAAARAYADQHLGWLAWVRSVGELYEGVRCGA